MENEFVALRKIGVCGFADKYDVLYGNGMIIIPQLNIMRTGARTMGEAIAWCEKQLVMFERS